MIKFSVHVEGESLDRADFDKKRVRKIMRTVGQKVQTDARRLVSRRAVSKGGQYPGRRSGTLFRATKYKVSRSGFLVTIAPRATNGTTKNGGFYPAILYYGVRRGARRNASHRKQQASGAWRIAPRENWTVKAAENRRAWAQQTIADGLRDALIVK